MGRCGEKYQSKSDKEGEFSIFATKRKNSQKTDGVKSERSREKSQKLL
jgi:hypothetical protein